MREYYKNSLTPAAVDSSSYTGAAGIDFSLTLHIMQRLGWVSNFSTFMVPTELLQYY